MIEFLDLSAFTSGIHLLAEVAASAPEVADAASDAPEETLFSVSGIFTLGM